MNIHIRAAADEDIPAIKRIANQHKNELGFVMTPSLRRGIEESELHVALVNGRVVGFVNWHLRRDGWSTVYEIAVERDHQRAGIGAELLATVMRPTRLKVTQDNPANAFYRNQGFTLARTEKGRKRALNVYEKR